MPAPKKTWICDQCSTKQAKPRAPKNACSKCGSEDVFLMTDHSWPCPECHEPKFTYDECQKNEPCKDCKKAPVKSRWSGGYDTLFDD